MKRPAIYVSLLFVSLCAHANPPAARAVPSPAEMRTRAAIGWDRVPAAVKQRMSALTSKLSGGAGKELPRCTHHDGVMHCYVGDSFCTVINNGDGTYSGGCGKL